MPVSSKEQAEIQSLIESASPGDLDQLRREAEDILGLCRGNAVMPKRHLSAMERQEVEKAIEFFVRLECLQVKGPEFRY